MAKEEEERDERSWEDGGKTEQCHDVIDELPCTFLSLRDCDI